MENIPQPADDPYSSGDRVRVYLSKDDPDAEYHGLVCEVIDVTPDDLDKLSGRELDKHHYKIRRVDTDQVLPVHFRHSDLVPEAEWPKRE
jgi:hypothetical protein